MVILGKRVRFTRSELEELRRRARAHGIEIDEEPRTPAQAFAALLCALGPREIRRFCEIAGVDPAEVLPDEPPDRSTP